VVGTLISTKLHVPPIRGGLVDRPLLCERLARGSEAKLTLVSAPAGFGKTTLLAEWLASGPDSTRVVAWLSLDKTDNEPRLFWEHVVAAIAAVTDDIGNAVLPVLQSGGPVEIGLAVLLNELSALPKVVDLVLDDYHTTDHPDIQAGVAFLLEHLPPNVHLIISTRADPTLPLPRLRARGELTELRSVDLRFNAGETATYLNEVMGLGLAVSDLTSLMGRTEGWIAALQLAALSMQGRDDVPGFIAGFAGNDKYIVDYLVEEVLERLSDDVRRFLLQTCFLGRLSGPLCDAVTGGSGSKGALEALDRQNLFVVPLDDRREWYRYHHLFADVLGHRFADDIAPDLAVLHRRAADWYEQNGERSEAISHALWGGHFERAAELIELAIPSMRRNRQEAALAAWMGALPNELVRTRPVLCVGFVGALVAQGDLEGVDGRLADAERCLELLANQEADSLPLGAIAIVDREQLRGLPAAIELYRAALAQLRDDIPGIIAHAERSFAFTPLDDHLGRAGAAGFLGIAYWTEGDLNAARRYWADCAEGLHQAGHLTDWIGATVAFGGISLARGALAEATQIYERALRSLGEWGGETPRLTTDIHACLSELHLERGDLQAANQCLLKGREYDEYADLPPLGYRWQVASSLVRQAEGDLEAALGLLNHAEALRRNDFFPNVRPISAIKARLRLSAGDLNQAILWMAESGVAVDDPLTYLQEYEHITLARVLLAQGASGQVTAAEGGVVLLLERLSESARTGGRRGSLIEISVLQALAHRARNEIAAALAALESALTLAEPEGHIRVFVNEGPPMDALLRLAAKRGIRRVYVRTLLGAFGPSQSRRKPLHPDLIEALSERELDVLRLLRSDLDGPGIARHLLISLNTLRTHSKKVYEKLGVNNRRSAVSRAEELDLFA
jgi:LuxR family maltose regulon positive regulatory protein